MVLLLSFFWIFLGCAGDEPGDVILPAEVLEIPGTLYSPSANNFEGTYANFIAALDANEAISIIAEVDHTANSISVGRVLNPTRTVFFGNPVLGTPLMQENQLVGLDLPQKVLFFENEDGVVYAVYNSAKYLESRYELQGVTTLGQISNALSNLVKAATNAGIKSAANINADPEEGIITKISNEDFESTYSNLRNAILDNENLQIVAELDHRENAASVDLELRPTRVIIFGNPNLGTPLMQSSQSTGLDLPQKILVWEDADGTVNISYNNPEYLQERHSISGNETVLLQITEALNALSETAAGN
ncbi:DUF302 domain-containing protein [Gillisia limnaea]|uniref:DUF302 domain-containing protein n=2 Tax=Gillisia TaxID=244698 RepID=H2BWE5_GILLR|nr:protein of unknown function DUF302 [Gillisia limnaea DSM 15749]